MDEDLAPVDINRSDGEPPATGQSKTAAESRFGQAKASLLYLHRTAEWTREAARLDHETRVNEDATFARTCARTTGSLHFTLLWLLCTLKYARPGEGLN